jgi:hypothetical protein
MADAQAATGGTADALLHEARNGLNTLALAVQLVERVIGRERISEGARDQLVRHLGAAGAEVEKVRAAVERLAALARGGDAATGPRAVG